MATYNPTSHRLQMLANGYRPIPNLDKICMRPGWNSAAFVASELTDGYRGETAAERIVSWAERHSLWMATGVRLDNGLGAIDGDVDDEALAQALWRAIDKHAPDVGALAPCRFGGGSHKFALFVRIEGGAFAQVPHHVYTKPGQGTHTVEIFGGAATRGGHCDRQFGVYGPHSHNADGSVARMYAWADDKGLHNTPLAELPTLTKAQALAIVGEFERAAEALGWQRATAEEAGEAGAQYTIDDSTTFLTTHSGGMRIDYAGLCAEFYAYGAELRCSVDFLPGRGDGGKVSHCQVGADNRHGCVAVFVYGDNATHFPVEYAPVDMAEVHEALKDLGKAVGAEEGISTPNWRERYVTGYPKPSFHNAMLAIGAVNLTCSLDVFHNRLMVGRGEAATGPAPAWCGEVTDHSITALRAMLSATFGFDLTEKHLRDAVVARGIENQFNPVTDMLAEAEAAWDGVKRLGRMAVDVFNCEDTPFACAAVRKTMIAAVARARVPGCKFDTILTLESDEGWNKSSAWRLLAGDDNFSDASILGHSGKEVMEHLADVWIHENADLAGMRKAEVETVKAFASRQEDRARPAFGHFLVRQPRHSIEVATTNAEHYLQSFNGNRRFWPVRMTAAIDLAKLRKIRLQLWGEAAHCQSQGESLVLDQALWADAGAEQDARMVEDPWQERLACMAETMGGGNENGLWVIHVAGAEQRVTTAAIFEHILKMPAAQQHRMLSVRLSEVMRKLGWRSGKFKKGETWYRGYTRVVGWGKKVSE